MKYRPWILIFMLLISFLLYCWTISIKLHLIIIKPTRDLRIFLDSPGAIFIDGNTQLANAASSGDGSIANPYIIKNKIISVTEDDGISICNTNAYFILENCLITNSKVNYAGIRLYNVTNAKIKNVTASNNYCGIYLNSSNYNTLINITTDDTTFGFYLYYSNFNTLTDIITDTNYAGIYLYNCNYTTITDSTTSNNYLGIELYRSNYNTLTENTVINNSKGIRLVGSNFNIIKGNKLCANQINIEEIICTGNIIENNDCDSNPITGITWIFLLFGISITIFLKIALRQKEQKQLLISFFYNF